MSVAYVINPFTGWLKLEHVIAIQSKKEMRDILSSTMAATKHDCKDLE